MTPVTVHISEGDIAAGGHGNDNDALVLALNAQHPVNAPWWCEIYSHGNLMVRGVAWNKNKNFSIDPTTTHKLAALEQGEQVAPWDATLLPVWEKTDLEAAR